MTSEETAQILVTARLLKAAEKIDWLSTGFSILAGVVAFDRGNQVLAIVALSLGLVAKYYGFRIAFDARLLEDVAAKRLEASDLDQALVNSKLASRDKAGRSWPERCRGARRLMILCAVTTVLQTVALMLSAILR